MTDQREDPLDEALDEGLRLYFAGKKSESLAYFQRVARQRGDAKEFHRLGINLSDLGRHEEAMLFLTKALERYGAAAPWTTWHWLGSTYCKAGRYEEALPYIDIKEEAKRADDLKWFLEVFGLYRQCLEKLGRLTYLLQSFLGHAKSGSGGVVLLSPQSHMT